MGTIGQDGWSRVQGRLRASVGEDAYENWLASLRLVGMHNESAKLSVTTEFLGKWIRKHYAERVLRCLQAEVPGVRRIDLVARQLPRNTLEPYAPKDMRGPAAGKPIALPAQVPDTPPVLASSRPCEPAMPQEAEEEARDRACSLCPGRVSVADIVRAVSRYYGVPRHELLSDKRKVRIVRARQVGMYLAKALTAVSLPEIGRRFGGRDHTTAMHSVHKVQWLIGERNDRPRAASDASCAGIDRQKLKNDIESLMRELKGRA